jgi:hypothetical protein
MPSTDEDGCTCALGDESEDEREVAIGEELDVFLRGHAGRKGYPQPKGSVSRQI